MRNTIIVSTHNRLDMLKRAVDSALRQTEPCQIIICDDGSDPDTAAYCLNTEQTNENVLYLRSPAFSRADKSSWLSFCHLINIAQTYIDTKYVSYLCDDDEYAPDRCQKLADYLDENPSIGCVFGRQTVGGRDAWGFRNLNDDMIKKAFSVPGRINNPVNHNTFMHRAEFVTEWPTDPDCRSCIDLEAVRSLVKQGCQFQEIDFITGTYNEHDAQLSKGA